MQFDFSKAKIVAIKEHVPQANLVAPKFERRGCWVAQPSYEALSGWAVQCKPENQPVEIAVPFKESGWHHVFLRAALPYGLSDISTLSRTSVRTRFTSEPYYSWQAVEQQEVGYKDLYIGAADLTGQTLLIQANGATGGLDCLRLIPMGAAERDARLRKRSLPATRIVAGMTDGAFSYRPADDREAAHMVYAHARIGIQKIYWRAFAVRCAYWTKVHETVTPATLPLLERYDILGQAVETAKKLGVEIHGCMRLNNVNSHGSEGNRSPDTSFRLRNPEKIHLKADGAPIPAQLSYAYPEVRRHKIEIMQEIAGYGVNGIIIDGLRTPPAVRFEKIVVDEYLAATGRDPRAPEESVKEEWLHFRAERTFTQLLREMRAALKGMGEYEFAVRTFIDPRMALNMGHDFAAWVREGLVDTVVVSPWYLGPQPVVHDIRGLRKTFGPKIKLLVNAWRDGAMAECEDLTAHMYDQGADGVMLYQSDELGMRPCARDRVWDLRRPETTRRLTPPPSASGQTHLIRPGPRAISSFPRKLARRGGRESTLPDSA